jgi:MFS family permease
MQNSSRPTRRFAFSADDRNLISLRQPGPLRPRLERALIEALTGHPRFGYRVGSFPETSRAEGWMQLLDSEILNDACELSLGPMIAMLVVGLFLWLFGWWSHRFWVVLICTILGGVFGLCQADALKTHPLAAAVLLAISCGMLALALVRLVAFLASGTVGLLLVQGFFPSLNQPLITFLVCGLLCLILFKWCMMALSSFFGAILVAFCALLLLNQYRMLNAPAWNDQNSLIVNSAVGGLAFLGFLVQFLMARGSAKRKAKEKKRRGEDDEDEGGLFGGIFGKAEKPRRRAA